MPDGYALRVERDQHDRVIARHYEPDPERARVVQRLFELADDDLGDASVARKLNAEDTGPRPAAPGPASACKAR